MSEVSETTICLYQLSECYSSTSSIGNTRCLKHRTSANSLFDAIPLISHSRGSGCCLAAGRAWESSRCSITYPGLSVKVPRAPPHAGPARLVQHGFSSFILVVAALRGKQQAGLCPESSLAPRLRSSWGFILTEALSQVSSVIFWATSSKHFSTFPALPAAKSQHHNLFCSVASVPNVCLVRGPLGPHVLPNPVAFILCFPTSQI